MNREDYIKSCAISKVMNIDLAGIKQVISVEGKSLDLPVLVYLHGGPGTPLPMNVGTRGVAQDLTDNFILVCWDQIGSGINNCKLDDVSISQVVRMTKDLILKLKEMFPNNKILVFGSSWGSFLASSIARKDLVDGIVIWGQIIKDLFHNKYVYEALEGVIKESKLVELKTKKYLDKKDFKYVSKTISKKTSGFINKEGGKGSLKPFFNAMLKNKDYKLKDIFAIFNNGYTKSDKFLSEVIRIDTRALINKIEVPYIILQGDTDLVTPTAMVIDYLKENPNPLVRVRVIEKSSHIPSASSMQEVVKELKSM